MQSFGTGVGQYQLHMLVVEDNLFRELDQSGFFRPNDLNIRITMAKVGRLYYVLSCLRTGEESLPSSTYWNNLGTSTIAKLLLTLVKTKKQSHLHFISRNEYRDRVRN